MANDPYAGLNGGFSMSLHQLISAVNSHGGHLTLGSGFRDTTQQTQLYNNAVAKYGEKNAVNWAAKPGTSNHEMGLAGDLQGDPHSLQLAHDLASQFNLNFPLNNEPWHVEPVGIAQRHDNKGGPPATYGGNTGDSAFNRVNTLIQAISGQQITAGQEMGAPDPMTAGTRNTSLNMGGNANYDALFQAAAQKYDLNPRLLKSVAKQESGFNPNARSGAGAVGLMQFMPGTAKGLGVNPLDPAQSIDGAARLLSSYIKSFGSVDKALAAYNAGPGAVQKYGGIPPYAETQHYVSSIMGTL